MPDLSIIQTASWWVFGTLLTAIISANVRRWASDKGHDGYLLSIWNMLPEWGHRILSGWRVLSESRWIWLCLGLSGGLGAALWISSNELAKTITEAKSQLASAAQKQIAEAKSQQAAEAQTQIAAAKSQQATDDQGQISAVKAQYSDDQKQISELQSQLDESKGKIRELNVELINKGGKNVFNDAQRIEAEKTLRNFISSNWITEKAPVQVYAEQPDNPVALALVDMLLASGLSLTQDSIGNYVLKPDFSITKGITLMSGPDPKNNHVYQAIRIAAGRAGIPLDASEHIVKTDAARIEVGSYP